MPVPFELRRPWLRGAPPEGARRTTTINEFSDPRLIAIYDTINSYAANTQPHFYSELAAELGAASIVDLGCGTGLITRELAGQGYRVTGVDPARGMIDVAARGRHGDRVHWVCGEASALGASDADLAIMSGHVAQFFVADSDWHEALGALHTALRPGGHLSFETRNPDAREWEQWTPAARWSAEDPDAGRIETWVEAGAMRDGIVACTNHYVFTSTGEELVSPVELRFRTLAELHESLGATGFAIERVYGDWDRRPAAATTPELIVVARRE